MEARTRRIIVRATAIGVQWLALTIALGSLVMRADASYEQLVSPHFGAAPVFIGAAIAGLLLGMTVDSAKYLAVLVIGMCFVAASFVAIITYAPVVDGVLVRTTGLDNFVTQRIVLMSLIIMMSAVPSAVAGNLIGGKLSVRQEIAPDPDELSELQESPWWESRHDEPAQSETESEQHRAV